MLQSQQLLAKIQNLEILDSIGDPISVQDTSFRVLYQNTRHRETVGDKVGEFCYRAYQNQDRVCEGCHLAMSFEDGKIHTVERSRKTDNGTVYSENTASPLHDSSGNIIAGIEIVKNISDRKQLEQKLRVAVLKAENETAKTETIIEAIGDYVSIQDRDLKIIYQNKISRDNFGDNIGEYCYKAYHGRDQACDNCHLLMCFNDGKIHRLERAAPRNNTTMHTEHTASPLRNKSGDIIAGIEVVRDVGERKIVEKALKKAHDGLENRVKERTLELEESNTALKVLLKQREQDQKEFENNILSNMKHLVHPYLEKLKKNRVMSTELVYLNLLESNLNEIVSPFSSKLSYKHLDFTPKEILIANLIKEGKQDKDMVDILNISLETVKSHRQNIRKKLGIYGKRSNLRVKLISLAE